MRSCQVYLLPPTPLSPFVFKLRGLNMYVRQEGILCCPVKFSKGNVLCVLAWKIPRWTTNRGLIIFIHACNYLFYDYWSLAAAARPEELESPTQQ